jgi:hypothetical protein
VSHCETTSRFEDRLSALMALTCRHAGRSVNEKQRWAGVSVRHQDLIRVEAEHIPPVRVLPYLKQTLCSNRSVTPLRHTPVSSDWCPAVPHRRVLSTTSMCLSQDNSSRTYLCPASAIGDINSRSSNNRRITSSSAC